MLERIVDVVFRREARRLMRLDPSGGIAAPPAASLALYLHVPFCEVLCPYCSFHRVRFEPGKARRYFLALRHELRLYHQAGFRFGTLYVGGGTPTVVPEELLETIALARELSPGIAAISVETNPRDLREPLLSSLRAAGVERLSVGVQTFDDGLLREMDRFEKYGSRDEILDHLRAAAGRFPTLNVDLIWNLPHQSQAMLDADLDALLASPASQASFYPLMTAKLVEKKLSHTLGLPGRARLRALYERIEDRLEPAFSPSSAWCWNRATSDATSSSTDPERARNARWGGASASFARRGGTGRSPLQ